MLVPHSELWMRLRSGSKAQCAVVCVNIRLHKASPCTDFYRFCFSRVSPIYICIYFCRVLPPPFFNFLLLLIRPRASLKSKNPLFLTIPTKNGRQHQQPRNSHTNRLPHPHPTRPLLPWKHGKRGFLGYFLLNSFCLLRIIGSAVVIHADATHTNNKNTLLINSIGLSPLLLACAGVLHEA